MKKLLFILIPLLIIAAVLYYWLYMRIPADVVLVGEENPSGGTFSPFNRGSVPNQNTSGISNTPLPSSSSITATPATTVDGEIPRLRLLSATPVGGFTATTTASSTLVHFIDRGTGHIYEASGTSTEIIKISNTTVPRVYESVWSRNSNLAILRYMKDIDTISNFYAELRKIVRSASSTDNSTITHELKGRFISSAIVSIAAAPKSDRIFTWDVKDGRGVGYISSFDESRKTQTVESPLTQVTVDWPEENTVTVATKASRFSSGYFYSINLKQPYMKKVVGPLLGLTAKMSSDAKRVLYSTATPRGATTFIYTVADGSTQEAVIRTFADKCVWSKLHPTEAYCAVPTEFPVDNVYPDDWYKGNVSLVDQIWHLDTVTGEVTLVANLLNLSQRLIDVTNLALDPKENFLYFINKKDLSLWSFDLND